MKEKIVKSNHTLKASTPKYETLNRPNKSSPQIIHITHEAADRDVVRWLGKSGMTPSQITIKNSKIDGKINQQKEISRQYIDRLKNALRTRISKLETQISKYDGEIVQSEYVVPGDPVATRKNFNTKFNQSLGDLQRRLDEALVGSAKWRNRKIGDVPNKDLKTRMNMAIEAYHNTKPGSRESVVSKSSRTSKKSFIPISTKTSTKVTKSKNKVSFVEPRISRERLVSSEDAVEVKENLKNLVCEEILKINKTPQVCSEVEELPKESKQQIEKLQEIENRRPTAVESMSNVSVMSSETLRELRRSVVKQTKNVSTHIYVFGILLSLFLVGSCLVALKVTKWFGRKIAELINWIVESSADTEIARAFQELNSTLRGNISDESSRFDIEI